MDTQEMFAIKCKRSVKCAGKQSTQEFERPTSAKPKCSNCGGKHSANYRCYVVAVKLQKIKDKKDQKRLRNTRLNENIRKSNNEGNVVQPTRQGSYAQTSRGKKQDKKENIGSID